MPGAESTIVPSRSKSTAVYGLAIATSLGGMSESTSAAAKPESKPEKVMPRGSSTSLLFTIAVVLSSVVFAVPVTVSRIVEGILDSTNPDGIKDTGAGLAYLGPILAPVTGVFAAQEIKPQARTLATDRGIRCLVLDYDAMRGLDDGGNRLF